MSKTLYSGFIVVTKEDTPQGPREVVHSSDAVAFLVHDTDRDQVLLVSQSRAPMATSTNPTGVITEVAAGRLDREMSLTNLILAELQEELGISATPDQVELLNSGDPLATSPGVLTEKLYLAIVRVGSEQIEATDRLYGHQAEGESIQRIFVPVSQLKDMVFEDLKTFVLVTAFLQSR